MSDEATGQRTSDLYRTKNIPERFDNPGFTKISKFAICRAILFSQLFNHHLQKAPMIMLTSQMVITENA